MLILFATSIFFVIFAMIKIMGFVNAANIATLSWQSTWRWYTCVSDMRKISNLAFFTSMAKNYKSLNFSISKNPIAKIFISRLTKMENT